MKTFDEIVAILSSQDNPAKVAILQELVKAPPQTKSDAIVLIVKSLFQDPDVAVRFWAKKVVNSTSQKEQTFAERNNIDDSLSSQDLLKLLEAPKSSSDATRIIQILFGKSDPSTFPLLISFLKKSKDAVIIATFVKNLGLTFPTEQTLVAVFPYLKYDDERVIANCIEGISNIPSTKTVEVVSQLLSHKNHRIRANAAKALSKQKPSIAKKAILNMLQMREKQHFVLAACHAIQQIGGEDFLPELIKLAPHPILGESSLMTIVAIGGDNAIGYLQELKNTCDGEISKRIDLAIQQIQRNARMKKVEEGISAAIDTGTEIISSLGSWIMSKNNSAKDQENGDQVLPGNDVSLLTKEGKNSNSSVVEKSPLANQSGNIPITCPSCGKEHKKLSKQCEFCGKQIGGNPPKGTLSEFPSQSVNNQTSEIPKTISVKVTQPVTSSSKSKGSNDLVSTKLFGVVPNIFVKMLLLLFLVFLLMTVFNEYTLTQDARSDARRMAIESVNSLQQNIDRLEGKLAGSTPLSEEQKTSINGTSENVEPSYEKMSADDIILDLNSLVGRKVSFSGKTVFMGSVDSMMIDYRIGIKIDRISREEKKILLSKYNGQVLNVTIYATIMHDGYLAYISADKIELLN